MHLGQTLPPPDKSAERVKWRKSAHLFGRTTTPKSNQPSWQHFHLNMTNFSSSKVSNTSTGDETQLTNPVWISFIFNIIVNSITCPFTILLNVLVIMAVKSRPRLQSKANILLACLAVTDAATGLIVQPAFILWMILKLLGIDNQTRTVSKFIISSLLRAMFVSSSLHLTLVTFERLVAIKFTMHYTVYVTNKLIGCNFDCQACTMCLRRRFALVVC